MHVFHFSAALVLVCATSFATASAAYDKSQHVLYKPSENRQMSDLNTWVEQETAISWSALRRNINPPGTIRGFVAASPSTADPDYFYSWTRDAALVMRVVVEEYARHQDPALLNLLQDYVAQEVYHQATPTACHCLGEPKFNKDGSGYNQPWGRPQNDGPAARALTFIQLAHVHPDPDYVQKVLKPGIIRDLDYLKDVWSEPCFDLWEEMCGVHFYTLKSIYSAFEHSQALFDTDVFHGTMQAIQERLATFWSDERLYLEVTQNPCNDYDDTKKPSRLDTATLLAALHAPAKDAFGVTSDAILATASAIVNRFETLYPLNAQRGDLGVAVGRYPEDTYDGYRGDGEGNPWFLTTAAVAEVYYRAIATWMSARQPIVINPTNLAFFERFMTPTPATTTTSVYQWGTARFDKLMHAMAHEADQFLATIQFHQRANGSLSEQFNRHTGFEMGARDLTWSYAAFISSANARQQAFAYL
ncbi:Six-hairpin glycosidase-like protein [Syncephalastrum racemosum]|uniref:glucan 1,4-alpha-glucosidase n=1 Tax=Syncephalastrum racemosum TaxID=13706 RepID=A0A1X2HPP7_SYNRA|nr:Six-hairpin glycosidase-like protein [Syncephalastrum racemosum]